MEYRLRRSFALLAARLNQSKAEAGLKVIHATSQAVSCVSNALKGIHLIELRRTAKEAYCTDDKDIQRLTRERKYRVIHDELGLLDDETWFCDVSLKGRHLIADKRTGSFYDPETMRCLTGNLRLEECD